MRWYASAFGLTGFAWVSLLGLGLGLAQPSQPTAEQNAEQKQTLAFLQKMQRADGSFAPAVAMPKPTLRATSAAVRAFPYFNAKVPNPEGAAKFVASCYDPATGGFADEPMGMPGVFETAVGLMAVVELNLPTDQYVKAAGYLVANAKDFEQIRIAAAGLAALKTIPPSAVKAWMPSLLIGRNADGTFGQADGLARDTASRLVTILRLGEKVELTDAIRRAIRDGQRADGGYGKAEQPSDLETTYRVMRACYMLKLAPRDPAKLRAFVASCRNDDGGYATVPQGPSTVMGCYYAGIVQYWLANLK
jgi:hypothetical protein